MTNKLLNLDDLASDIKQIKLDGNTHVMREMTVQEFIDRSKQAEIAKERAKNLAEDAPLDTKVQEIVRLVDEAFPTITVDRLNKLSLAQLTAILNFTLAAPEDIEKDVVDHNKSAEGNA